MSKVDWVLAGIMLAVVALTWLSAAMVAEVTGW
jgi:hypothetical protein